METNGRKLLVCDELRTYFDTEDGIIRAVDGVSFHIDRGETLGIVGESGCGKTITALSTMQLVPGPYGKIVGGHISYYRQDGTLMDITGMDPEDKRMRDLRGNEIAMIFQEPMSTLNPVYSIGEQIMETVRLHQHVKKAQARDRAIEMLELVGISAPEQRLSEYPHQFSGGMCQRAMIAIALSCNPSLLIADEPTTALDVTIEAQILELMNELQRDLGMSIVIITHDLGVIGEVADRVIVMYTGKIVESATTDELFYDTKHPYTEGLMQSIPRIGTKHRLAPIIGNVPPLTLLPQGCHFSPRCPKVMDRCTQEEPAVYDIGQNHLVKCWLYTE